MNLNGAEISQSAIPVVTPPQTPASSQHGDEVFGDAMDRMRSIVDEMMEVVPLATQRSCAEKIRQSLTGPGLGMNAEDQRISLAEQLPRQRRTSPNQPTRPRRRRTAQGPAIAFR